MLLYSREMYHETASKWRVSLQVVMNGGATSSGEQDNEDTELMAIYTTENGIAEKVPTSITTPTAPSLLSQVLCGMHVLHLGVCLYLPECGYSLCNGNRGDEE